MAVFIKSTDAFSSWILLYVHKLYAPSEG